MLKQDIQTAVIKNLKAKNETEVKVLRFILSQIKYEEIAKQKDLTDEEIITVIQKEIKKRKEAIEMFRKANRIDLVQDEEKQLMVISGYVPKQLSEKEVEKVVDEIIASEPSTNNIGQIIGTVMQKLQGKAEGSMVASLVKRKIMSLQS